LKKFHQNFIKKPRDARFFGGLNVWPFIGSKKRAKRVFYSSFCPAFFKKRAGVLGRVSRF